MLSLLLSPTSMPFVSPFCFCFWGRATHFFTAGRHAAWVNRKKVGSKDRREDEMFLTNVTAYSFVYDVDDELGASKGREKHPCFYDASRDFWGGPTHSRMGFHAVHRFSRREALCMLPLPLLPSFLALYTCRLSASFSPFRSSASACASGGTFASFGAFYSSSPLPLRATPHKMTTPLYPNNCKQWLKADGSLEKWKPKEAGQMSFVVFQLKAQTCMCPQHATFVVLVHFVPHVVTRQCLLLPLPMLPYS